MNKSENNCYIYCDKRKIQKKLKELYKIGGKRLYGHYNRYCYVFCKHLNNNIDPFELLRIVISLSSESIVRAKLLNINKLFDVIIDKDYKSFCECLKDGLDKTTDYLDKALSKYKDFIKDSSNEAILLIEKDENIKFDLIPRIMTLDNEQRGVEHYDGLVGSGCPFPSWIKGYLRQALHKIIFIKILDKILKTKDIGNQKVVRAIFETYADIIRLDDEGYLFINTSVDLGSKSVDLHILNLVGLLMGSSNLSSYITVSFKELSNESVCEYVIGADKVRAGLISSILYKEMSSLNTNANYYRLLESVVLNFNKLLVVLTPCIANAAKCIIKKPEELGIDQNYRFFPLTARYPLVYEKLPEKYVYSKIPKNGVSDDLIGYFKKFIDLYAEYYVGKIKEKIEG